MKLCPTGVWKISSLKYQGGLSSRRVYDGLNCLVMPSSLWGLGDRLSCRNSYQYAGFCSRPAMGNKTCGSCLKSLPLQNTPPQGSKTAKGGGRGYIATRPPLWGRVGLDTTDTQPETHSQKCFDKMSLEKSTSHEIHLMKIPMNTATLTLLL